MREEPAYLRALARTRAERARASAEGLVGDASDVIHGVRGGLRKGVVNDSWAGSSLYDGKGTKQWWKALQVPDGADFAFLEVGCFDEDHILAAKVAREHRSSAVLAVHTCGGLGSLDALQRLSDEDNLGNLFIAEAPLSLDFVRRLREIQRRHGTRCDVLAVSELLSMAEDLLPFEFEELVAELLGLCDTAWFPESLPDERFFSYWKTMEELFARSHDRVPSTILDTHLTSASSSSSSSGYRSSSLYSSTRSSSYTSSSSSSSSTSSSSSSSSKLWKVSLGPLDANSSSSSSGPAGGLAAFPVTFLLEAGLIPRDQTHLFVQVCAHSCRSQDTSLASNTTMAVLGTQIVCIPTTNYSGWSARSVMSAGGASSTFRAGRAFGLDQMPSPDMSDSTSEAGEHAAPAVSGNPLTLSTESEGHIGSNAPANPGNSDASGVGNASAPQELESEITGATADGSNGTTALSNGTLVRRRLLAILYDQRPVPGPRAEGLDYNSVEGSSGTPGAKKRARRVSSFLSDKDQDMQQAMLRDGEEAVQLMWQSLRGELAQMGAGSCVTIGR